MTILTWAMRLVIFFFLVVFAVQNSDPVKLKLFVEPGFEVRLVIVLLAFFSAGVALGLVSLLGVLYRQRREISRLRQQLGDKALPPPELPPAP
jgi:uncharacterized integral membrane protein